MPAACSCFSRSFVTSSNRFASTLLLSASTTSDFTTRCSSEPFGFATFSFPNV